MRRLAVALLASLSSCLAAAALDGSAGAAACTAAFPNGLSAAASAEQLVTVVASATTSTRGTVDMWRSVNGCWTHTGGPWSAWLGGRGVS
ncbi:MAG: hypothetical protein ACJ74R_02410, partial [Gaiellaceae bacterium]